MLKINSLSERSHDGCRLAVSGMIRLQRDDHNLVVVVMDVGIEWMRKGDPQRDDPTPEGTKLTLIFSFETLQKTEVYNSDWMR